MSDFFFKDKRLKFYVYMYYRLDGSPCYVGKGQGDRVVHHLWKPTNKHLWRIIQQAREADKILPVKFIQIGLSEEEATCLEKQLIKDIGRADLGLGPLVNFTDGGEGISGFIHSKETKEKLRKAKTGTKTGPHSLATKEKIRAGGIGKHTGPLSAEHKAKISAGGRGLKRESSVGRNISAALKGKPKSLEHRAALSEAARGRILSDEHKAKISLAQKGKSKSPKTSFCTKLNLNELEI
jgi:hypothetical protein